MFIWLYILPNKIQHFKQMLICKFYKNLFYPEFILILIINLHGELKYLVQLGSTFLPKNMLVTYLYNNIFMINVPIF